MGTCYLFRPYGFIDEAVRAWLGALLPGSQPVDADSDAISEIIDAWQRAGQSSETVNKFRPRLLNRCLGLLGRSGVPVELRFTNQLDGKNAVSCLVLPDKVAVALYWFGQRLEPPEKSLGVAVGGEDDVIFLTDQDKFSYAGCLEPRLRGWAIGPDNWAYDDVRMIVSPGSDLTY